MKKPCRHLLQSMLALGIFFFWGNSALAIGISPAQIVVQHLLPNTSVEKTITISDLPLEFIENFNIEISENLKPFIDYKDNTPLIKIDNTEKQKITIPISIPQETKPQTISGTIEFLPNIKEEKNTQYTSTLENGIVLDVQLEITNQLEKKYSIQNPRILQSHVNQDLFLLYEIENHGNQHIIPDYLKVEIYDKYQENLIETIGITPADNTTTPASAHTTSTLATKITLPNTLSPDYYKVLLNFYHDEKIHFTDSLSFEILNAPLSDSTIENFNVTFSQNQIMQNEEINLLGSLENYNKENVIQLTSLIYKNNKLLQTINTPLSYLEKSKQYTFSYPITLNAPGTYTIETFGKTAQGSTNIIKQTVTVKTSPWFWVCISTTILIILLLFVKIFSIQQSQKN